jgi:hypothetical protein
VTPPRFSERPERQVDPASPLPGGTGERTGKRRSHPEAPERAFHFENADPEREEESWVALTPVPRGGEERLKPPRALRQGAGPGAGCATGIGSASMPCVRAHSEVENGWELKSSTNGEAQLQQHVARLPDKISPVANTLKELSGSCIVQISCVVYAEAPPPLNFPADLISRMAAVNAALDIDL